VGARAKPSSSSQVRQTVGPPFAWRIATTHEFTPAAFLLALIAIFAAAKLFGELAERIGQPAVLGEMIGGIAIGVSGLRLIDPQQPVLQLLAELGVLLLLFLIGLESDIGRLLAVGGSAMAVALAGVLLPFGGGFAVGKLLGLSTVVSIFLGAALTATSVGITARVFADLGHIKSDEAQVILGAAVVDDILGLILLTVVSGLAGGVTPTVFGVAILFLIAFGFVAAAIVFGSVIARRLLALISHLRVAKALLFASLMFAFVLAWAANRAGAGLIIGAFAAGLILARTDRGRDIEQEVHAVAQFFIPIFFVLVGAAVDLRSLNPLDPEKRRYLIIGLTLTAVAIAGKFVAGYFVFGRRPLRKIVIGVGMIPRGEVGLVFAQLGLMSGLLTAGLYSSVALMVMVTTFIAPPLLRRLLAHGPPEDADSTVRDLVTESVADGERR
jgi:Kef-type K+ transport system membrane component KefB